MEERFKSYVAVYLILEKDNQILMSKRKNTGYQDGNYSLVSGHLDGAETIKKGLIREVKEEIGIELEEKDLKLLHVIHRYSPEREYVDFYLIAKKWKGEIKNMEPEKCEEVVWFSKNNLPENTVSEVRFSLEKIRNGEFFTECGFN